MKISSYFHYGLLLSAVYLAIYEPLVAFAYFIATLPLIFFTSKFAKIPERLFLIFFTSCGAIWVVYLIRPLFLIPNNEFFSYSRMGAIDAGNHISVLLQISLYSTLFLTSLYMAIFFRAKKNISLKQGDSIKGERLPIKKIEPNFLTIAKQPLILAMMFLVVFNLLLKLVHGNRMSAETSLGAIIELLLPLSIIAPLSVFYLIFYRNRLRSLEWLSLFFILAIIVCTGFVDASKAAFLQVIMFIFVFMGFKRGNFKISIKKAFILIFSVVAVLLISFPLATNIKYFSRDVIDIDSAIDLFFQALTFSDTGVFSLLIDKITGRFAGYDGLLVVNLAIPHQILNIFSEQYIFQHSIAKLIPGWSVPGMSLGKAVGIYYTGHALDVKHAGGLGLFGALFIVGGVFGSYVYVSFLGLIWGVFFRIISGLSINQQNKKLLNGIFCVQIIFWLISGNLDRSISSFIILSTHILFYSCAWLFLIQVIKPKRPSFLPARDSL